MTMTLNTKEFDEAITLWLQAKGFNTSTHSIDTRVIAGRTDSGSGTRVEVTLEPIEQTLDPKVMQPSGTGKHTRKFGQVSDE